ncbi:hypothetical protein V495_02066 [Pseudogymnoascus sp. VKM F-4514 (FW-929)]|nr:hypothetical protein V495_02066 [Pseudogymnoascus sp. VKM F-4514 (FW-929)]
MNKLSNTISLPQLIEEAFEAAGVSEVNKGVTGQRHGNKRDANIEFGGSMCGSLTQPRISSFTDRGIGDCTGLHLQEGNNLVSDLASNNALKNVVEQDGLAKFVVKNPCQKGKLQRTTLASTTEAIDGAVWYDCRKDFETVRDVVHTLHISQKYICTTILLCKRALNLIKGVSLLLQNASVIQDCCTASEGVLNNLLLATDSTSHPSQLLSTKMAKAIVPNRGAAPIEMDSLSLSTACSDTLDTPNISDDGEASIFEEIDGIILIIDAVVVIINEKSNIPRNFKTLTRQPFLISKILEDIQAYVKTANETTRTDLALTIEKCKDQAMDLFDLFVPEDCYSQLDKSIQVIKGFLDNLQGIVTKFPETTTRRSKEALAKAIKEVSQMKSESFLNTDDRRRTFTHFGSGPQNINTGNGIQYNETQSNPVSRPPNVVRLGLFAHFGSGHQNINTGKGTQYNSGGGNQKNGPGTQYIGMNFIA